jgi:hypothetical protein
MKRTVLSILAVLVVATLGFGSVATAELSGDAEAHVYVDVTANIAVSVLTPIVDIGSIQSGEFASHIRFRIDANVEQVSMQIIATDLYKGNSGTSLFKIPVGGGGTEVVPVEGNETEGGDNFLEWDVADTLRDMNAQKSVSGDFESGQAGHFSQDVDVTVTYTQDDDELPTGEYSGWVKIVAMVEPV